MGEKTKKALFIIESLKYEDEKTRREGRILQQIMRLSGTKVQYIYIRTQQELGFALEQFRESTYRYLHISCHGSPDSVAFTLDQTVLFEDFAAEIRPYLKERRLFFSACSVVNDELAKAIIPRSGCRSIVGPRTKIDFDDALLMWASFYHLAFRDKDDGLKGGKIRWMLRKIRHTFGIEFDYYRADGDGYRKDDIDVK